MAENWDTIGYRIEEFIYDEFDIDLNSIFDDSSSDEVNESNKNNESNENNWTDDWSETISAVKNGQDEQRVIRTGICSPERIILSERMILHQRLAIQMPVTRGMILQ